jgi:hypothetical protein
MPDDNMAQLAIHTIRTLSIDAVQAAKSGHPGTPMALAPLIYVIWNRVLRFDPRDPIWPNRDRFVLSNGHASMLLWSILHLTQVQAVNAEYERLGHPNIEEHLGEFALGFAYEVRKSFEGARETNFFGTGRERVKYFGAKNLWPFHRSSRTLTERDGPTIQRSVEEGAAGVVWLAAEAPQD